MSTGTPRIEIPASILDVFAGLFGLAPTPDEEAEAFLERAGHTIGERRKRAASVTVLLPDPEVMAAEIVGRWTKENVTLPPGDIVRPSAEPGADDEATRRVARRICGWRRITTAKLGNPLLLPYEKVAIRAELAALDGLNAPKCSCYHCKPRKRPRSERG